MEALFELIERGFNILANLAILATIEAPELTDERATFHLHLEQLLASQSRHYHHAD